MTTLAVISDLIDGFGTVLTPENLAFAAIGVLLGTFVGVLPGIGPALTIALLLPITFNFEEPTGAFIMFAGIYFGGMYGGSTTSILLNTPGESASVATAIEGYEMAKRGRGGPGARDRRDRLVRGRARSGSCCSPSSPSRWPTWPSSCSRPTTSR